MTQLIPQTYKPTKKIYYHVIFLRKLSLLIIKIIFPFKKMIFRNIFLQKFQSFIEININNIKLKFKDGNERLFIFLNTQYIIEKDLINWINSFSKQDIFLDIGSSIGLYSIYSAKKGNLTIACEGHPANLSDFLYNMHLNNVEKNIITLPIFLADSNKTSEFFLRDITSSSAKSTLDHNNSPFKNDLKEAMIIKTLNFSLDRFFDEKIIPVPSKIKIDVDGFEFFILRGINKYLKYVDEIMIEMFEYDVDVWKCYYDNKNLENIDTLGVYPDYHKKNDNSKNPYYEEIINYLEEFSFKEKTRYGNNIIFQNYSKKNIKS